MVSVASSRRVGRTHARTRVLLLVHDLDIRVINAATSELLLQLVLDPTRNYQPTGRPDPRPEHPQTQQPRTLIMGSGCPRCPATSQMMELRGFEPLTPSMRTESTGEQEPWSRTFPHVRCVAATALTPSDRVCPQPRAARRSQSAPKIGHVGPGT
jgi:hypothetical protein